MERTLKVEDDSEFRAFSVHSRWTLCKHIGPYFFRARRREQGFLYRSKGHSEISSLTARISSSASPPQKTPLYFNILRSQRGYRVDPTNCLQKRYLRTNMTQNTPHSPSTTDVASHPFQSLRDHTGLACSTTQHLAALRKHNPRRQVVAILDTVIVACDPVS